MAQVYRVTAHNSLPLSENKIHDDAVARRLGFTGALVPGVDVYACMTQPVVARWGLDWLKRGVMEARFSKPVYDGAAVEISGVDEAGVLAVTATSDGVVRAVGRAWLSPEQLAERGSTTVSPQFFSPGTASDPRPEASEETLAVGTRLEMTPVMLPRALLIRYLRARGTAIPFISARAWRIPAGCCGPPTRF